VPRKTGMYRKREMGTRERTGVTEEFLGNWNGLRKQKNQLSHKTTVKKLEEKTEEKKPLKGSAPSTKTYKKRTAHLREVILCKIKKILREGERGGVGDELAWGGGQTDKCVQGKKVRGESKRAGGETTESGV